MANPPKMFMEAKKTAEYDKICSVSDWVFLSERIAPIIIMPDMAFDTLINGE